MFNVFFLLNLTCLCDKNKKKIMDLKRFILLPLGIILINGLMARCMPTELNSSTSGLSNNYIVNNETNPVNLSQMEERKNSSIFYVYPESLNKQAKNIVFVYPDRNASAYLANLFNTSSKNASTNLNISSSAQYKSEDTDNIERSDTNSTDFIDQNTTVISESDQRARVNETMDIRLRDRLFQLSKTRYERRNKFNAKLNKASSNINVSRIEDVPMEIINEAYQSKSKMNATQIVSKHINNTDAQEDQAKPNDSDLLEAESNEYKNFALLLPSHQDVVNKSFNDLDIIPFTFDDAVIPLENDDESTNSWNAPLDPVVQESIEAKGSQYALEYLSVNEQENQSRNNKPIKTKPIKKYKGENFKKDHLFRTWKGNSNFPKTYQLGHDDIERQNVSAQKIVSFNQPVSMWSGYLTRGEPMLPTPLFQKNVENAQSTYSRSPDDSGMLLIIGPIPRKLSPLFDKKYEPFKDQLQLPNL